MNFKIEKKLKKSLARTGTISTPHGEIETPAFVVVGTKATVKALGPDDLMELGVETVLANAYHLYFQPGSELIKKAGGLHKFMNWHRPIFTDSGGFQVFSLGANLDKGIGKVLNNSDQEKLNLNHQKGSTSSDQSFAKITEDGVEFRSPIDGSRYFFTPEKSIEIQYDLNADIMFAFDECTSPLASYEYQKEAIGRTHRWAERSVGESKKLNLNHQKGSTMFNGPALFGIVQGGRCRELREESAKQISGLDFNGFGIGGSFDKDDMGTAVRWVNEILPEDKPRHLLGIGNVSDIFVGIENGVDTFDCVAPTREARNGALYTKHGRINILNAKYRESLTPIEPNCACYTCANFTKAYLIHLFRARELLAYRLASIHNLYFLINLIKSIRWSILDDTFLQYKDNFLRTYQGGDFVV